MRLKPLTTYFQWGWQASPSGGGFEIVLLQSGKSSAYKKQVQTRCALLLTTTQALGFRRSRSHANSCLHQSSFRSCQTDLRVVQSRSAAFQIGERSPAGFQQLVRLDVEHVVPRPCRSPHLVVLQQVRINEHTQLSAVTERWHATIGFGNRSVSSIAYLRFGGP